MPKERKYEKCGKHTIEKDGIQWSGISQKIRIVPAKDGKELGAASCLPITSKVINICLQSIILVLVFLDLFLDAGLVVFFEMFDQIFKAKINVAELGRLSKFYDVVCRVLVSSNLTVEVLEIVL